MVRKALVYITFIIASVFVVGAFVTANNYIQLLLAVVLYPPLVFFAYKLFLQNSSMQSSVFSGNMSHAPLAGANINQPLPSPQIPPVNTYQETKGASPKKVEIQDVDKRTFLKVIGAAGLSYFIFSLIGRSVESLFVGRSLTTGSGLAGVLPGNSKTNTGNTLADGYSISEIDDSNISATYYGFVNKDGAWFIMKENAEESSYRYASGKSNFEENWANRNGLKYDYYYNLF
jgi:hypothetical protein